MGYSGDFQDECFHLYWCRSPIAAPAVAAALCRARTLSGPVAAQAVDRISRESFHAGYRRGASDGDAGRTVAQFQLA